MVSVAEYMGASTFIVLGLFIAAMPHIKICAAPYDANWYYMVGGAIVVLTWLGITKRLTDVVQLT